MKKALPKNPDWSYQHLVADEYLRDFENAFVSSVQDLQDAAKVEVIEESLRRGRPEMLVNFVGVREHLEDPLSANSADNEQHPRGFWWTAPNVWTQRLYSPSATRTLKCGRRIVLGC